MCLLAHQTPFIFSYLVKNQRSNIDIEKVQIVSQEKHLYTSLYGRFCYRETGYFGYLKNIQRKHKSFSPLEFMIEKYFIMELNLYDIHILPS